MVSEDGEVTTASAPIDQLPILMTSPTPLSRFAELYERHYETVFRAALRLWNARAVDETQPTTSSDAMP